MIIPLLITHILIGLALVTTFVVRYLAVFTKRIETEQGRGLILGLSTALVASGFALVIVAHSPLTGACLSALAIVAVVGALEGALQLIGKRTTT
jgi:hypothetical protein